MGTGGGGGGVVPHFLKVFSGLSDMWVIIPGNYFGEKNVLFGKASVSVHSVWKCGTRPLLASY